jgi:outer membrane receptor protein involved in Fe transport
MTAQFKFFIIILAALLPGMADAAIVRGRVTDADGEGIGYAIVSVNETDSRCRADGDGYYSLTVPEGTWTVVASATGYNSLSMKVTVDKDVALNFKLSSINELNAVTIVGKSLAKQRKESEFTVNSIDVSSSVNTTSTLSDLVGRTSGIRIRAEGGLGSDFDVSINGLTGSAIRYFIDGVPMETRGSDVSLANLPLNQIARVDVYKGVVPSFLGSDAMGGAINIITKNNRKRYVDASVAAGSFGTYTADFSALGIERRTGLMVRPTFGFGYSKNDYMMRDVEVWDKDKDEYIITDRKRFHDSYRSVQGGVELMVQKKTWADRLSIGVNYSSFNKEIQTGAVQAIVYGQPRRKSTAWNIGAQYSKDSLLLPGMSVKGSVSYTADHSQTIDTVFRKYDWNGNWIPSQRNEITGGARSVRHYRRPLLTARVNIDYNFGGIHIVNLNYSLNHRGNKRYDDLDPEYEPAKDILSKHIAGLSYSQSLLGGRLQNTAFGKIYVESLRIIQLSDRWNEDAKTSKVKTYPGYGIGSRYNVSEWLQVKASAEHAVRLPLSRELLGNGTTVAANMSLRPESSGNINAGVFGNLRIGDNHSIYYEAGGYWRSVRDMIHLVTNENTGLSLYSNISRVTVRGVEGEISYHFADRLHLTTNWSYSVSRDMNARRSDGKPSVTYKNRIPNRPWFYGNTELTYIHRQLFNKYDRVRFGYSVQYVHWFFLTWEGYGSLSSKSKIPTQLDQSIYLTYSWKNERYNVTGEVNNIFDRTLYDNYKLQKPGRSIMVKFRLFLE